jgi:phosphoglycolate phosphatase-like HAD superfamily hydrolase
MPLRYRCLVVDHDDTSVMSTPGIHYPAHVEALKRLRPGRAPISLDGWLAKNFEPGLIGYLRGELGFTDEESGEAYRIWKSYTCAAVPEFFPGLLEIYAEHKAAGGFLVVVSHSEAEMIERDYRAAGELGERAKPDLVFGWDEDPELRKPAPYPLAEAMRRLGLSPRETLVLDDLKPGAEMAASLGVDFAAAGWGHSIPAIKEGMAGRCRYYLDRVEDLRGILFD